MRHVRKPGRPASVSRRPARSWARAKFVVAGIVAVAVFGSSGPATAARDTTSPPPQTLGIKPNPGFLDLRAFRDAEKRVDRKIAWTVQMTDPRSPDQLVSSVVAQLQPGSALAKLRERVQLVLAVPLAFGPGGAHDDTGIGEVRNKLQQTSSGAFDDAFTQVARELVERGYPDAVVRLGHEMSGPWFSWSAVGNASEYVAAFRHVRDVMHDSAPRLQFDWTVARQNFAERGVPAYPGDAYVDVVGIDVYYSGPAWTNERWEREFRRPALEPVRAFAVQHNKPMSVPEWGLRGVDEPKFVGRMHAFFASLPSTGAGHLLYQSYFDTKPEFALASHPRSRAAYVELFGAGRPS